MLSTKYYLGIDGGGTKTAFLVIDENFNIMYESFASAISIDTVSLATCEKILRSECSKIPFKVDAIFAGLGGMNSQNDIDNINKILKSLPILKTNGKFNSGSDVINALYGALNGNDGIILIAGTGAVAYGKNNNNFARSGGYCYQEEDPGSAYYLGFKALQHLARVLYGRRKESVFSDAIKQAINYTDFDSVVKCFTKKSRTEIASLAKIVTKYQDDFYASKIIEEAVDEVIEMIKAVYNRLNFKNECKFSINWFIRK